MLQQTVARLTPLVPPQASGPSPNAEQASALGKQLPAVARKHVLTERLGERNTAAAIALAAIHVRHAARVDALLAVLPADHLHCAAGALSRNRARPRWTRRGKPGRMVVLGIPPTRPETGFGYIERQGESITAKGAPIFAVRCF